MNVESAYAECLAITRREARNFAWGIVLLPRPKRVALAALYAFARRVDDVADGLGAAEDKRARLLELQSAGRKPAAAPGRRRGSGRADRHARALPGSPASSARPRGRGALGRRAVALRELGGPARVLPPGGGRRGRLLHRRVRALRPRARRAARRDARPSAPADQHHARRRRGLAAWPGLPPAGRTGSLRSHRSGDRGGQDVGRVGGG